MRHPRTLGSDVLSKNLSVKFLFLSQNKTGHNSVGTWCTFNALSILFIKCCWNVMCNSLLMQTPPQGRTWEEKKGNPPRPPTTTTNNNNIIWADMTSLRIYAYCFGQVLSQNTGLFLVAYIWIQILGEYVTIGTDSLNDWRWYKKVVYWMVCWIKCETLFFPLITVQQLLRVNKHAAQIIRMCFVQ